METTFEEEIRLVHEEKERKQYYELLHRQLYGEDIYSKFRFWCRVFIKDYEKARENPYEFARFLKEENIELTFLQRKHISEKYFGYKFEFDENKQKWSVKKL